MIYGQNSCSRLLVTALTLQPELLKYGSAYKADPRQGNPWKLYATVEDTVSMSEELKNILLCNRICSLLTYTFTSGMKTLLGLTFPLECLSPFLSAVFHLKILNRQVRTFE